MNIFILDYDKTKNAKYHVDRHCTKMLVEQMQLLSSAYYYTGQSKLAPYKLTHKNHPCSIWVRESLENWLWLHEMTIELYIEYQHRYSNKQHKSGEKALQLEIPNLPSKGLTKFPQAMPKDLRCDDTVTAYRRYYNRDKRHLFSWRNRKVPYWIESF